MLSTKPWTSNYKNSTLCCFLNLFVEDVANPSHALVFALSNFTLSKRALNAINNFVYFLPPLFGQTIKNLSLVSLGVYFCYFVLFKKRFASKSEIGFFYSDFANQKTWRAHSILINKKQNFLIDFKLLIPRIANIVRQNSNFNKSTCKIFSFFHIFSIYFTIIFCKLLNKQN